MCGRSCVEGVRECTFSSVCGSLTTVSRGFKMMSVDCSGSRGEVCVSPKGLFLVDQVLIGVRFNLSGRRSCYG